MKFKKIKELISRLAEQAKKDKKKLALVASTGVVAFGVLGLLVGYGLRAHNTNVASKAENIEVQEQDELESLKKEFNLISLEDIREDGQSEYDAIKERFEKAIADGNVSLAKQELGNLKGLCNSNSQTDTLVSAVADSNLENEHVKEDEHDHEHDHEHEHVNSEQSTGVPSNTDSTSPSSSTNNSASTSTNNSQSTSSTSKPSQSGGSSSSNSNVKPTHIHSWVEVYKDIYHQEEGHYENVCVKDAWTESVPVYEQRESSICNGCGKDITGHPWDHIEEQMLQGNLACGGYHTELKQVQVGTNTIKHDAIYEKKWVVTKPAWTEKVLTGYKCTDCGETK